MHSTKLKQRHVEIEANYAYQRAVLESVSHAKTQAREEQHTRNMTDSKARLAEY